MQSARREVSRPAGSRRGRKDLPLPARSVPALLPLLLLIPLVFSTGCSTLRSFFGGHLRAEVVIAPDANRDSAVAVEFVVVRDKDFLKRLMDLTARQWFEQRDQLRRDFPKAFQSWDFEWIPGQQVPTVRRRFQAGARSGIVFADYLSEGPHRARFDPYEPIRVRLGKNDLEVQAKPSRAGPPTILEVQP